MFLKNLSLQNFRNYKKAAFDFDPDLTIVVGPNTAGKSNLIEAIFYLATAQSFRTEKENDVITFGQALARLQAVVAGEDETVMLEAAFIQGNTIGNGRLFSKKFKVNDVPKRRVDFTLYMHAVLFSPLDLEIIIGSPGQRRRFLDTALLQVDQNYHVAQLEYTKALRQRNALLEKVKETGRRDQKQFAYWDDILIAHGQAITKARNDYIDYINTFPHDVFALRVVYDKSTISKERLLQYADAEIGVSATLVGPHRDDIAIEMQQNKDTFLSVRSFGSRGQQRLAILQMKFIEIAFLEEKAGHRPLLLLDDVFSELDNAHIAHVLAIRGKQQTVITTTHEEFVDKHTLRHGKVIVLKR